MRAWTHLQPCLARGTVTKGMVATGTVTKGTVTTAAATKSTVTKGMVTKGMEGATFGRTCSPARLGALY